MSETVEEAQDAWISEFGLLDKIAMDVYPSARGSFLKAMADAWLRADAHNKRILKVAWIHLIDKYDLQEEPGRGG